jgi:hypothetical protein
LTDAHVPGGACVAGFSSSRHRGMRKERLMFHHDHFKSERQRVERVLQILEDLAARLEAQGSAPFSLLGDVVEFVRATEAAAYEASLNEEEGPTLSACVEQHIAARVPVNGMQQALLSMRRGEPTAAVRFAEFAREYASLRRDHMRFDDRLFANDRVPTKAPDTGGPEENPESPSIQRIYERLIKQSSTLREAGV